MAALNPPSGSERFDFLAPLWNPSGTNTIAYAELITELESGKKQSVINSELRGRVSNIEGALPSQVSTENPLVDKDFVNSSIATNTATFKGTYTSIEELEQIEADNNDYAFVVTTDSAGNTVYNRYKYSDIEDSSDGSDSSPWLFEYALNNSSFTAELWATINSGITSMPTKVSDLTNDAGYIISHQSLKTINSLSISGSGDVKAGITEATITPVNKDEINSLSVLRQRILLRDTENNKTKVPNGYTFDLFMLDLFRKVNEELTETEEVVPKVTISKTGNSDTITLEVGDTTTKTVTVTVDRGTYTDGTLRTYTITNGESTDGYSTINAGCPIVNDNSDDSSDNSDDELHYYIKDSNGTVKSTDSSYSKTLSLGFTYSNGALTKPNDLSESSGQFKVELEYGDSTNYVNCVSSYGSRLYTTNPMLGNSVESSLSADVTLTLKADFYRFWGSSEEDLKNNYSLGAKSAFQQVLTNGYVFLYPSNKTVTINWTTMAQWDSHPSSQDYTAKTVYISLPSNHNPSWSETVPESGKYATYTLYTLTAAPVGATCKISIS